MIKNNQDFFESLNIFVRDLKDESLKVKFKDALEISSVPGEILGQIRLELVAFLKTNSPALRHRAEDLKKYLDDIL